MMTASAPASRYFRARWMASSMSVESVRAMMQSGVCRALSAAASLLRYCSAGSTRLPSACPQRFGEIWSSIWIAATPADSTS